MGLLTKLTTDGSNLSINDGLTPAINPLTTPGNSIHSTGIVNNSYSLNGSNVNAIGALVAQELSDTEGVNVTTDADETPEPCVGCVECACAPFQTREDQRCLRPPNTLCHNR